MKKYKTLEVKTLTGVCVYFVCVCVFGISRAVTARTICLYRKFKT